MNSRINLAIDKLQQAQRLFLANSQDERIVDLLTQAAEAIADAIDDAQNPIGPPSNADDRPPE